MSIPLTLILSMAAALLGSIVKQCYVNQTPKRIASGFIFNTIVGVTAAVILVLWGGFGGSSVFTVLLGLLFGAVTALQGVSNVAALQCGPMSYTSVIISFSTLVSALSGVLFFDEGLGWAQIVGIALMLVSFVLAAKSDGEEKKANLKWLILCIVAFAATGAIGIMQKVHQSSAYKGELNAFLVIAFISSSFFCGSRKQWGTPPAAAMRQMNTQGTLCAPNDPCAQKARCPPHRQLRTHPFRQATPLR